MPILTTEERIGTIVDGKIRIDRVLGEGGMGVVFAGTHLRLEKPVAVKFLHARSSQSAASVERFLREARATSRLSHPNVVDVRDVDIDKDGSVYMVLELLHGQSLRSYLDEKGVLGVDEAMSLLGPVMDALAAAHAQGIVHRDVKPENVFLSRAPNGSIVPKVVDFGLARLVDSDPAMSPTVTGAVMGTPLYMSPEQASGNTKLVGDTSDVWSVAVMAYECLSGALPFEVPSGSPVTMVMVAVMTGRIVPLAERRRDLAAISEVLVRALERDPEARIASMKELRDALVEAARVPRPEPAPNAEKKEHVDSFARTHISSDPPPKPKAHDSAAETKSSSPPPEAIVQRAVTPRLWPWIAGASVLVAVGAIVYATQLGPENPPARLPEARERAAVVEVERPPPARIDMPETEASAQIETPTAPPAPQPPSAPARTREPRVTRRDPPPAPAPIERPVAPAPSPPDPPRTDHRAGDVSLDDF